MALKKQKNGNTKYSYAKVANVTYSKDGSISINIHFNERDDADVGYDERICEAKYITNATRGSSEFDLVELDKPNSNVIKQSYKHIKKDVIFEGYSDV